MFAAVDPMPTPAPDFSNANTWQPCTVFVGGMSLNGMTRIQDHSTTPFTAVSWSQFLGNPGNANYVPFTYCGPFIAGSNLVARLEVDVFTTTGVRDVKWAGKSASKEVTPPSGPPYPLLIGVSVADGYPSVS